MCDPKQRISGISDNELKLRCELFLGMKISAEANVNHCTVRTSDGNVDARIVVGSMLHWTNESIVGLPKNARDRSSGSDGFEDQIEI